MKPQCETSAQCLKELARVMEQFGIETPIEAVQSQYVKAHNNPVASTSTFKHAMPQFYHPDLWKFAIAEVEGKPVFIGDELYDNHRKPFIAEFTEKWVDEVYIIYGTYTDGSYAQPELLSCSWIPNPKTVMVELTVEDAAFVAGYADGHMGCHKRIAQVFRKALEGMK